MRVYGRFLKNIAGVCLLLALCSLLLPFCKFNAGAGDTTLSGFEVAKAGGKAGYTYMVTGGVPDDFVLKAPYTWGNVKESISYVSNVGGTNLLIFCGAAIIVPIVLCFFAMCMLFLAEGKKTMFLPTVFSFAVAAEMLFVLLFLTDIKPFLLIGVYLFTILAVLACFCIFIGWITGGYRRPSRGQEKRNRDKKEEADSDQKKEKERKFPRKRKKLRGKKKSDKRRGRKKKDKGKTQNKEPKQEKKQEKQRGSLSSVTGHIGKGTGMYQGLSWDLKATPDSVVTIGTTPEAMSALQTKEFKKMEWIAQNNCKIAYDAASGKYRIENHANETILLVKDGKVIRSLRNGESVKVSCQIDLQLQGRQDKIKLE